MDRKKVLKNIEKGIVAIISAIALFFFNVFVLVLFAFSNVSDVYLCLFVAASILIEFWIVGKLWGFIKKKNFRRSLFVALGICVVIFCSYWGYESYVENIPTVSEGDDMLISYAPYAEDTKVVSLEEESSLKITDNIPVLDGATALYPIYSAYAKAVYPKELLEDIVIKNGNVFQKKYNEYLKCSTTTYAYEHIVTGRADIIFAALPSEEQEQFAKENGVQLVYTPIGKEAFVFFVNAKNPIDNITVEDVQKIYSGELTNWSQLGVSGLGEIKSFQRDKGSGSQSTLEKVMSGKNLIIPPKEEVIDGMGGIIEKTADYKNFKNAIGYSFRFYSTEMVSNNQIKLLSVNGVYPSLENIENGTYPLASYFYAVTRSDVDENTLKLIEWIKGEQGQKIIKLTGYTPLEN